MIIVKKKKKKKQEKKRKERKRKRERKKEFLNEISDKTNDYRNTNVCDRDKVA